VNFEAPALGSSLFS